VGRMSIESKMKRHCSYIRLMIKKLPFRVIIR
jgi:hypothetical protein